MTGSDVTGRALNRKSRVLGGETADQLEKRIAGSWNRKSRVLGGETADQLEKKFVGSWNRKSRGLRWETAGECEKGSWAQGEVKPRRKRGLQVQSPIGAVGVVLGVKTTQN